MRKVMAAPVLILVLFIAASAPLAEPQPAQAFDPRVHVAKAALAAFKARFHDRAVGFRTIKESQAEAVRILEQKKAQADWWAEKGYITPAQAAAVSFTLDQVVVAMEELAQQERRMVRNDTRFLKTFVQTIGQTLKNAAPQILAEQLGLPPLGARTVGSILQGEKPATAVLDALITKLQGGELVEPSKEPFEDLLTQVGALQDAASALRGADRIKLLGDLFRVRERIGEITGLPIPQQSEELDKLRDLFEEAEGTIAELGKVRDGWIPKYSGPNSDRFQNNPQWQEIWAEIVALSESPDVKIRNAVAAGMALTALEKVKAELIEQGIDPDAEDIDLLAAQVIRERIRAAASGDPITTEQAVQNVLGRDEPDGPDGSAPTALPTAPLTPVATTGETATVEPSPTPVPTPTPTPTPTETPTPGPLPTRSIGLNFTLGAFAARLDLVINFAAGTVSGTLQGTSAETVTSQCGSGDQVLETAEALSTSTFTTGFSGAIAQTGGPFSAPVSISGTTSFTLTEPFELAECLQFNTLPPASSFSASGSVSGLAVDGSPTSVNVSTTLGSFAQ